MLPDSKSFTAAVKSLAARRGLTLTEVAESSSMSLGVLRSRLSVTDGPNSSIRLLALVAGSLGVTLRQLIAEAEACQEAVSDV